jgi:hypothetical protein
MADMDKTRILGDDPDRTRQGDVDPNRTRMVDPNRTQMADPDRTRMGAPPGASPRALTLTATPGSTYALRYHPRTFAL